MKFQFLLMGMAAAGSLAAGEYMFNRDFSLPGIGYLTQRYIEVGRSSDWSFRPAEFRKDGKLTFVRIQNPAGEFFELHSGEFKLEKGKKYNVTIRARASAAGYPLRLICYATPNRRWLVHGPLVQLQEEWKNFTYPVVPKETAYYHFQLCPGMHTNRNVPSGYADIALVSITDDTPSASDVDCGVLPEKTVFFSNDPVKAKFALELKNHAGKPVAKKITVKAVDDYCKNTLFEKTFNVKLAANEYQKLDFTETISRYGSYQLVITGADRAYGKSFNFMGKYEPRKIRIPEDFCIGGNYGTGIQTLKDGMPRLVLENMGKEEELEILAKAGIRVIREHDGGSSVIHWTLTEPQPGKFDFRYGDWTMGLYEKYGITAMPVFGNYEFVRPFESWSGGKQPQWLLEASPLEKTWTRGWNKNQVLAIPHALWRRYIRACAEHFGDRLKLCEILNEPNLHMTAEHYADYLKIASEEIRKASPNTHINGIGITWDYDANDMAGWTPVIKSRKMLDMVDSAGFHPYGAPHLGSPIPADRRISTVKQMLKDAGKPGFPFWNTECYYLSGNRELSDEGKFPVHYTAWRYLTDLAEGVQLTCPIHLNQVWQSSLLPGCCERHEVHPGSFLTVLNRMAILLEGAKPVSKRYLNSSVILYRYKTFEGKDIAAVWKFGPVRGMFADLSGFTVLDMYGNAVPKGKLRHLEITESPYYILPGAKPFDPAITQLTLVMENPLVVSPQARLIGDKLYLRYVNDSAHHLGGYAGYLGGLNTSVSKFDARPHKDGVVALTVRKTAAKNVKKSEARMFFDGKNFNLPVQVVKSPLFHAGKKYRFSSPDKKLSFEFICRKSDGMIHFSFAVKDSTNAGLRLLRSIWESDAVEIFLDSTPCQFNVRHPKQYDSHVSRLFFMPREKGDAQFEIWSKELQRKDVKYSIVEQKDSYSLNFSIPEKVFSGKLIGFDCKVDDAESPKEKAKRELRIGTRPQPFLDRMAFGIISME